MVSEGADNSLRSVFAGRRGRLLIGLLLAEFAAATQGIAYSTVLPLAAKELNGTSLYGATLASGTLSTILVLAVGSGVSGRLGARASLLLATGVFLAGVVLSAVAPTMVWVLMGSVLRGLAAGLLAAFGLTAIGGLYSDAVRPRVLALFALIWLLPSFVGPALNAVIALSWGWRWTMAWPAVLILAARLVVARDAAIIPWRSSGARIDVVGGGLVVAGLVAATIASGTPASWWSVSVLIIGSGVAGLAAVRTLRVLGHGRRMRLLVVFTGVNLAFFGGAGLITVAVIEGMGHGVVAGSIAFGAGLVAWSLTGLRHTTVAGAVGLGLGLVTVGLAAEAVLLTGAFGRWPTLVSTVVAFGVVGLGMGLAYPRLSSGAFDEAPPELVGSLATAVAFAEIAGTALGSVLGGGLYSMADSAGAGPAAAIGIGFGVAAAVGAATWAVWSARTRESSRTR